MSLIGVKTVSSTNYFMVITSVNMCLLPYINSDLTWENLWHMIYCIEISFSEELQMCFVHWLLLLTIYVHTWHPQYMYIHMYLYFKHHSLYMGHCILFIVAFKHINVKILFKTDDSYHFWKMADNIFLNYQIFKFLMCNLPSRVQ